MVDGPQTPEKTPFANSPSASTTCTTPNGVHYLSLKERERERERGYVSVAIQQLSDSHGGIRGDRAHTPFGSCFPTQGVGHVEDARNSDPVRGTDTPFDSQELGNSAGHHWFRPGDILPPHIVELIASDPWTEDDWWANDDFVLQAAGVGVRERPPRPIPAPRDAADDANLAAWEMIADRFMRMKDGEFRLNESEIQSWWIGFRGYAQRGRMCRMAYGRLEARKVMEEEEAAERKRRAKEGVPDQSASPSATKPKKGRKK